MKRSYFASLLLYALIPVVMLFAGSLFSSIDPQSMAGHSNYERNYHLFEMLKHLILYGGFVVSFGLWVATCFFLLQAKKRTAAWMLLSMLGSLGFVALSMLNDREPHIADVYHAFRDKLSTVWRIAYECLLFVGTFVLSFIIVLTLEEWAMIFEAGQRGVPVTLIQQERDASSGMLAFSEGWAILYLVPMLYLLWPVVVNIVCGLWRRQRLT